MAKTFNIAAVTGLGTGRITSELNLQPNVLGLDRDPCGLPKNQWTTDIKIWPKLGFPGIDTSTSVDSLFVYRRLYSAQTCAVNTLNSAELLNTSKCFGGVPKQPLSVFNRLFPAVSPSTHNTGRTSDV